MPKKKYVETWRNLIDTRISVNKEELNGFFKFMYERQEIWYKRFVLKLPRPWTNNEILRDYKFTNIYRELDRNSIYLIEKVSILNCPKNQKIDKDIFFRTIVFRYFNNPETFEEIGGVPSLYEFDIKEFSKRMHKINSRGDNPFTNAYFIYPGKKGEFKTRLDKYLDAIRIFHEKIDYFYNSVKKCKTLKEVHSKLLELPAVAGFIAYEFCIDLMYAQIIPFDENDWVNAGPGAKLGLDIIFPSNKKNYDELIEKLVKEQDMHFKNIGVNFQYLNGKKLTLRGIEHSLCEYAKYWKMKNGVGKQRMKFKPVTK